MSLLMLVLLLDPARGFLLLLAGIFAYYSARVSAP